LLLEIIIIVIGLKTCKLLYNWVKELSADQIRWLPVTFIWCGMLILISLSTVNGVIQITDGIVRYNCSEYYAAKDILGIIKQ
jgi:hypothetical protein